MSYCYMKYVSDFDECSSSPCSNGGTCVDALNKYTCQCTSGFIGNQCDGGRNSSSCRQSHIS